MFLRQGEAAKEFPAAMPRPISLTQRREDTKIRGKETGPRTNGRFQSGYKLTRTAGMLWGADVGDCQQLKWGASTRQWNGHRNQIAQANRFL